MIWKFVGSLVTIVTMGAILADTSYHNVDDKVDKYMYGFPSFCSWNQMCKSAYKNYFECKCPSYRPFCTSQGTYYDAMCVPRYALDWMIWLQPHQRMEDLD